MGQLLVRDLDDAVIALLKQRAARNGRSTEAEHRAILEAAVRTSNSEIAERARQLQQRMQGGGPDGATIIRDLRDQRADRG